METIKIDEDGRYALIVDDPLTQAEIARLSKGLNLWWELGDKFCVINMAGMDIRFERVDSDIDSDSNNQAA